MAVESDTASLENTKQVGIPIADPHDATTGRGVCEQYRGRAMNGAILRGNRIPMRIAGGIPQLVVDCVEKPVAQGMFQHFGLIVHFIPRVPEVLHQPCFDEPVSPHHAQRVVEGLFELGVAIIAHPLAGRIVPELGDPQVRERFFYSYRLIYEIRADQLEVLAVLHGRRLLESIGERFEG